MLLGKTTKDTRRLDPPSLWTSYCQNDINQPNISFYLKTNF